MLASSHQPRNAFAEHHRDSSSPLHRSDSLQTEGIRQDAATTALASSVGGPSMDRGASDYSQSGLPSPYPSNCGDNQSEAPSVTVDHASAAQYATSQQSPEVRSNAAAAAAAAAYSTSATPTSEYGVYPNSARSGSFPDHLHQRPYHPSGNQSGSSGDPTIAAPSPTYGGPTHYSPYAPPPPSQEMTHAYGHSGSNLYAQPRPDWSSYGAHGAPLTAGHHVFPQTPTSAPPQRNNQVYSFVPIPGAQQHKRPRRRYEEIERMYKCGWQGCEKAYGTLNHLNAHVTMQSHGNKRTPEEFKEIRKEWKARKKEEDAARKADDERHRQSQAGGNHSGSEGQAGSEGAQLSNGYAGARGAVQLPPIGYQPSSYPAPSSTSVQQQGMPDYNAGYMQSYQPASPYGQPSQQLYNQPRLSDGLDPTKHIRM